MSNSIDQLYVKSSPVEFHQHLSKVVCPSTMSNSIDYPTLSSPLPILTTPVFSLQIAVELSDTANWVAVQNIHWILVV